MGKASGKDIFRTIWKEKKRFFSIMMITVLGVTLMTGLEAGCRDLRNSADRFYDAQDLFDISIMSTLGLTGEDVAEVEKMEGVRRAEGGFSEVVHTKNGGLNKTAEVKVMYAEGLNIPYVVEGQLPTAAEEIAVSVNYMNETGKGIGDTLTIEEILDWDTGEDNADNENEAEAVENDKTIEETKDDEDSEKEDFTIDTDSEVDIEEEETPNFPITEFTITAVIIDVMDINNADSAAGFRATPNADYTFFVTPEAVETEVFTAVYVALEGTKELICYSPEYESITADVMASIEADIMEQREQARYDEITGEAYDKIAEKEEEMYEEFADIEAEFADAKEEISDGWQELEDGKIELADGWKKLEEKEAEAAQEIADAKAELEDAYTQLSDAWLQLNEADKQINIGQAQLDEGKELLQQKEADAKAQLAEAEALLQNKIAQNQEGKAQAEIGVEQIKQGFAAMSLSFPEKEWNAYVEALQQVIAPVIAAEMTSETPKSQAELEAAIGAAVGAAVATPDSAINTAMNHFMAMLPSQPGSLPSGVDLPSLSAAAVGLATCNVTELVLNQALQEFTAQKEDALNQIAAGWAQLEAGQKELDEGRAQADAARGEVIENYKKWQDGMAELTENEQKAIQEFADARAELADGEQELIDGEQELLDGEKELAENEVKYIEEKGKAENKIAEARQEVADIDMTKWYVQDRTSLSGYANVDIDATCIESIATVFTIVFFIVAILISLTTVTRMVEEERGLIGTYKALGFTDREIRRKYVIYAFTASFFGALLGDVGGFVVLPEILFIFFDVMYLLPEYYLEFEAVSGTLSGIAFMTGIVGAAFAACYTQLRHVPADLMRPKSPKEGSRVLLERITPVWKRMSFLNKVTARNLFRYKKRMLMTILGIMGCTALLVFGFAIKDSVDTLLPAQYGNVYKYDLLAATLGGEDNDKLLSYLDNHPETEEYLNIQVESVKLKNAQNKTEKVQLMVFENKADLSPYLTLESTENEAVTMTDEGMYLTQNAAKLLGLEKGASGFIQRTDLTQKEVPVADVVKHYLGNNIYMSRDCYEALFGEYEPNGALVNIGDSCPDQIAFGEKLSEEDWILSSISTESLKLEFSAAFTLINIVVYVVLVLAAGLAFVVLFTLASINISERERELATIKVLGFYDREVHLYVNKETLLLTAFGILLGLPVGAALSSTLTEVLNMPSIYFAVTIYTRSYFITAGIALLFALIVQFLTDRSLNVIDPVEALKSVE